LEEGRRFFGQTFIWRRRRAGERRQAGHGRREGGRWAAKAGGREGVMHVLSQFTPVSSASSACHFLCCILLPSLPHCLPSTFCVYFMSSPRAPRTLTFAAGCMDVRATTNAYAATAARARFCLPHVRTIRTARALRLDVLDRHGSGAGLVGARTGCRGLTCRFVARCTLFALCWNMPLRWSDSREGPSACLPPCLPFCCERRALASSSCINYALLSGRWSRWARGAFAV